MINIIENSIISLLIGVTSVIQTSYYVTPSYTDKKKAATLEIIMVSLGVFVFLSLSDLYLKLLTGGLGVVFLCVFKIMTSHEKIFCVIYNVFENADISLASILLAELLAMHFGLRSDTALLAKSAITAFINISWCIIMVKARPRAFSTAPLNETTYYIAGPLAVALYIFTLWLCHACYSETSSQFYPRIMLILLTGMIFVVVLIILIIFFFVRNHFILEQRNFALSMRDDILRRYLNDYAAGYEDFRNLRHDQKHLIANISALMAEKEYDRVKDLLSAMTDEIDSYARLMICENPLINAIINSIDNICCQKEIKLNLEIRLPDPVVIDNIDLSFLLMNILTNATESCEKLPSASERFIDFLLITRLGKIIITSRNPVSRPPLIINNNIKSTKEDNGNLHGRGLRSIRHITKKYNGKMTLSSEENLFVIRVIIDNTSPEKLLK